jgi:hypothetical protein
MTKTLLKPTHTHKTVFTSVDKTKSSAHSVQNQSGLKRRPVQFSNSSFIFETVCMYVCIQRSGFDSRRYHIFWEVVGLERGPLSLVSTIEELLGRKSSGSGLKNREYGRGDPSFWPRGTLYPQMLEQTSPTSGGRSVCIVRSRTQATEFVPLFSLRTSQLHRNVWYRFWYSHGGDH